MRILTPAAALIFLTAIPSVLAEDIDQATLDLVTRTASKGYAAPAAATVSHIRKSKATNGSGYCGEVTIEGGMETTTFHVLLETPTGPSVLRLSDFTATETDPQSATVHELFRHVGCITE